jgi:hypothetical protein
MLLSFGCNCVSLINHIMLLKGRDKIFLPAGSGGGGPKAAQALILSEPRKKIYRAAQSGKAAQVSAAGSDTTVSAV